MKKKNPPTWVWEGPSLIDYRPRLPVEMRVRQKSTEVFCENQLVGNYNEECCVFFKLLVNYVLQTLY